MQANGADIYYRFDGPADGPVLVLSNSLMSTHRMWYPQMDALTERYCVLRYDTRGHGASEITPGPYKIQLLAEDVVALLDALDLRKVHFVGLSMGGMIGQYLGANHADRLLSLALCDTASEMPPREMWNDRIATAEAEGLEGLVDSTLKRWFTVPFLARGTVDLEIVAAMIVETSREGYIACASAVRDMSQSSILSSITPPTIVIVGREDPACTLEASEIIHAQVAGSELVVIDDASHLSNIEKPQEFTDALLGFLDRQ